MHTETSNPRNAPAKLYEGKKEGTRLWLLVPGSNKPHSSCTPESRILGAAVPCSLACHPCSNTQDMTPSRLEITADRAREDKVK